MVSVAKITIFLEDSLKKDVNFIILVVNFSGIYCELYHFAREL